MFWTKNQCPCNNQQLKKVTVSALHLLSSFIPSFINTHLRRPSASSWLRAGSRHLIVKPLVCWDGSTLKLVFSSAELMADRVQSRARPSSNGLALQSSGTGGSAPAACPPMMRELAVVTRTNISLRLRLLK